MDSNNSLPLVTIITIVSNNVTTIRNCIQSVAYQDYENIEHILIDNCSTDGTLEAIYELQDDISLIISEPDDGIYFALNKGINLSNGKIIGFLNSDDVLKSRVTITKIVSVLLSSGGDAVYGDLQYFSRRYPNVITRLWKAGHLSGNFIQGWMPPHPTFYTYKDTYLKYGNFDTSFKISSDYEMMLRLLYKNKIRAIYIPEVLVKMQRGGISNQDMRSVWLKTKEDLEIMRGFNFDFLTLFNKNLRKFSQLFLRR
ncbi:MAG: glycosyltransferase [Flavobacteriaceae bacterium]|jgi:glycosyltransferase involved in cell wall biosynthesis|nr:glycosyltransferase [Flavobacteriaceae bacterium]